MSDHDYDAIVPRVGLAATLASPSLIVLAKIVPNEILWTSDAKNLYV
jgi:hypothetical protein